jgi:hypothetical protein
MGCDGDRVEDLDLVLRNSLRLPNGSTGRFIRTPFQRAPTHQLPTSDSVNVIPAGEIGGLGGFANRQARLPLLDFGRCSSPRAVVTSVHTV